MPQTPRTLVFVALLALLALPLSACHRDTETEELRAAGRLGRDNAPIVMVYYTDYECDGCRRFARDVLPRLRQRYIDPGRLRIVAMEFASNPGAVRRAVAARCAGEFGKYWAFHDALLSTSDSDPGVRGLARAAVVVGVPADPFDRCLASGRYDSVVAQVSAGARSRGIGRPLSIFLRRTGSQSMRRVKEDETTISEAIDALFGIDRHR